MQAFDVLLRTPSVAAGFSSPLAETLAAATEFCFRDSLLDFGCAMEESAGLEVQD